MNDEQQAVPMDGDDYTWRKSWPQTSTEHLRQLDSRVAALESHVRHLETIIHRLLNGTQESSDD